MISRVGDSFARGTRKGSCNFKERCTTVMKSDGENWGRLSKDFVRCSRFFQFTFVSPESLH